MTINTIDPATPGPTDPVGQGDDQIRALKQAITNTFPQAPGSSADDPWDIPLQVGPRTIADVLNKADAVDLNALDVRVGSVEISQLNQNTRLDTLEAFAVNAVSIFATPQGALDAAWPVGSMYIAADGVNPENRGFPGTWVPAGDGRFLVGGIIDFGDEVGNTDSEVVLTESNLPQHKHAHTTFREDSGQEGDIPATFFSSPTRNFRTHLAGRDASTFEYAIYNTDEGVNLSPNPDPVDLSPAALVVRFYRRTE